MISVIRRVTSADISLFKRKSSTNVRNNGKLRGSLFDPHDKPCAVIDYMGHIKLLL